MQQLSSYIISGQLVPGTIIDRLIGYGRSPIKILFTQNKHDYTYVDGTPDSLRPLLCDDNFE